MSKSNEVDPADAATVAVLGGAKRNGYLAGVLREMTPAERRAAADAVSRAEAAGVEGAKGMWS